ncbi:MAG: hypothetical protein ACE5F7_00800, partial [Nitrospiria bacterium]
KIYEADLTFVDQLTTGIELISEYYVIDNKDPATDKSHTTSFFYVQAGKTFADFVTPYARYESFEDLDTNDPYFKTLGTTEYRRGLGGVRFDFTLIRGAATSIKVEAGARKGPAGWNESYAVQWTFGY